MTANSLQISAKVQTGADLLLTDGIELISNKRIGILTNHTGCLANGKHIVDAVVESCIGRVTALFGPEHGILGNTADGEGVENIRHPILDIPIFSLYGKNHKPIREMFSEVDILVCDIQDVGARFYTFISTIALALEGAAENNIPIVILDRPNPIRGISFDGPVRDISLKSFVGWMPIPVTHGMTIGELAKMWNDEGQLLNSVQAKLEIVSMKGWNRCMWYDETGLRWIPPSPNMQTLNTAIIYPGLCFVEGTSVSEGRGTRSAFELIGAPWMDAEKVINELNNRSPLGVRFSMEEFLPEEIPGMATEPKYEGMNCRGIRIHITDRDVIQPVRLGIEILSAIKKNHPNETEFKNRRFDILTGVSSVRKMLNDFSDPENIYAEWNDGLQQFGIVRSKYLLYS